MQVSILKGPRGCAECFVKDPDDIMREPCYSIKVGPEMRRPVHLCEKCAKDLVRMLGALIKFGGKTR